MIEFAHDRPLDKAQAAGLDARLSALVAFCEQVARDCVEAAADDPDYFDSLRFAVVTEASDLLPGGSLSAFLGAAGDPLPSLLERLEGSHPLPEQRAHWLLLSVSDTGGDHVLIADEALDSAWRKALEDLHPSDNL